MNRLVFSIFAALMISSCGGEGGNGDGPLLGPSDDTVTGIGVNRGLTGTIIANRYNKPWALDLATGKVSSAKQDIPGWTWHSESERDYHNLATFGLNPTYGANPGYTLSVNGCWSGGLQGCAVLFDKNFNRRRALFFNYDITRRAVESRDGKFLAVQSNDDGFILTYDISGENILEERIRDIGSGNTADMTWGTDEYLHYTKWWTNETRRFEIHPTDDTDDGSYKINMPDGALATIRWSRDGSKYLLHQEVSSVGHAIYVNSGGRINRIAIQGTSANSSFFSPEWSDDGEWVTFLVGASESALQTPSPYLVAVPADATDAVIEGSDAFEQPGPAFRVVNDSYLASDDFSNADPAKWYLGNKAFWAP